MAILKCETCGAKVKSEEGKFTATCEYCGNEMTIFESTAEFEIDSKGVLVQYNGKGGDVVVPDDILKIGNSAFINNERVLTVKLPETVVEIASSAFEGCSELEEINLPASLETLGSHAFYKCNSLKSAEIPDGIMSLKKSTFCECFNLEKVTLPKNLCHIEDWVFDECKILKEIILPSRLKSIGFKAFCDCASLTEVEIPDSVQEIGKDAFERCSALKSIKLSNKLTAIPSYTFSNCTALEEISIPSSVATIGSFAFQACNSLKTIHFSEGLKTIEGSAFYQTKSLVGTLELPDSLIDAPGLSSLKCQVEHLIVGKVVESLPVLTYAFPALKKLTIREGATFIPARIFNSLSELAEVELPDSLEEIKDSAFHSCKALKKIIFPASLRVIGVSAFDYCTELRSFSFKDFENSKLEKIGNSAFESCKKLKNIHLPNSVKTICDGAFKWCDALEKVEISEGCESLGAEVFNNTDAVARTFILPSSIKEIGEDAFYSWKPNYIKSPKNAVIEMHCTSDDNLHWEYIKSEAERRAEAEKAAEEARQREIARLKAKEAQRLADIEMLIAANAHMRSQIPLDEKKLSEFEETKTSKAKELSQKEAYLATLTGIFAGGKRKKCQEEIDAVKGEISKIESEISKLRAQINDLPVSIAQNEARIKELEETKYI